MSREFKIVAVMALGFYVVIAALAAGLEHIRKAR